MMRIFRVSAVRISTRTKSPASSSRRPRSSAAFSPPWSDHGDERDAGTDGALDVRHEVHADADLADVAEEHPRKRAVEAVVQAARSVPASRSGGS
jgi:hypothetical protein